LGTMGDGVLDRKRSVVGKAMMRETGILLPPPLSVNVKSDGLVAVRGGGGISGSSVRCVRGREGSPKK